MMTKLVHLQVLLVCCAVVGCGGPPRELSPSAGARLLERIAIPPLEVSIPRVGRDVERSVLPNGMVLYLASDPGAATLDVLVTCRAGRLYRDGIRPAVGESTAYLLRSGGTLKLSHQQVADELERLGISIDVTTGMEMLSFTMTALDRSADQAVSLLADMFRRPAFDPRPLQAFKGQVIELLRRLPDSPAQMLPRELARLLYTDAHPAGRFASVADVRSVSREDLVSFWSRFVRPENMWIAAVGKASIPEIREKIRAQFADWSMPGPLRIGPPPPVEPRPAAGVYFRPRAVAQSSVLLGHFGVSRGNPDRYAIELLNLILGGNGFSSRLVERLRTREGLAYAVGSSFPTTNPSRSLFRVSVQTASPNALRAVQAIQEEMRRLQQEPVSRAELNSAKDFLVNNFAFRFSSRFATLQQLLSLEIQGRPVDDLETLMDRFRAVTAGDIQQAARNYLHPDELTIVVMGGPPELADQLRALGPVRPFVPPEGSG